MENAEGQSPLLVSFIASSQGAWRIERIEAVVGESLPGADQLEVVEAPLINSPAQPAWVLKGVTSNVRYTNRSEVDVLNQKQEGLHRPQATRAALIPIRKNAAWWKLAQDERRRILEEDSHHIAIGLEYLPAIARRLHHCRDLSEPFDFLTWFEYAPDQSDAFEELVQRLRRTKEWDYVEREIDIRLVRS
jgi:chlorite dismutase